MKQEDMPKDRQEYGEYSSGIKALIKSFHAFFVVMAVIIIGMFVYVFTFNGFFTVEQQDIVLVYRFGKFFGVFEEDWHWVFPYPVDTRITLPKNTQSVTLNSFWKLPQPKGFADMPDSAPTGPLIPGKDGYLLTGDANIIMTKWQVIYHIDSSTPLGPRKYYEKLLCPPVPKSDDNLQLNPETGEILGTRGPRTVLRSLLESVIIKVTAHTEVMQILKDVHSDIYMKTVEKEFIKAVNALDVGIVIDSVMLLEKDPPPQTKNAFSDVLQSEQESSTEKQMARQYAVEQENRTSADESKIIADAEAYRMRVVSEIQAEKTYFEAIREQCKNNSNIVLVSLYNDTISKIISSVQNKFIIRKDDKTRQEIRLKINPEPKEAKPKKKSKRGK